jgi:hypothetical protein
MCSELVIVHCNQYLSLENLKSHFMFNGGLQKYSKEYATFGEKYQVFELLGCDKAGTLIMERTKGAFERRKMKI